MTENNGESEKILSVYGAIKKEIEEKYGIGKKWEILTFRLKKVICEEIIKNGSLNSDVEEIKKKIGIK